MAEAADYKASVWENLMDLVSNNRLISDHSSREGKKNRGSAETVDRIRIATNQIQQKGYNLERSGETDWGNYRTGEEHWWAFHATTERWTCSGQGHPFRGAAKRGAASELQAFHCQDTRCSTPHAWLRTYFEITEAGGCSSRLYFGF